MKRTIVNSIRARAALAVLSVGAMGLAAPPAAFAHERSGPGEPGTKPAPSLSFDSFFRPVALDPVSWTD